MGRTDRGPFRLERSFALFDQDHSDNRKGRYEDGEFRQASFTILVECIPFPYNRVKLERMGENLGEYRVMNAEPLTTVGRTQIVV